MTLNRHKKYTIVVSVTVCIFIAMTFQNCSEPTLVIPPVKPKTVTLKVNNYCPESGATLQDFFAYNQTTTVESNGEFSLDSDLDGIKDDLELTPETNQLYYISPYNHDTNGDYYRDFINLILGLDVDNQFRLINCETAYSDTDRDGLTDCEEKVLEIDPLHPDTDLDGIPDGLEIRHSLNPNDKSDALTDQDHDGYTNIEEVKMNSPHRQTNTEDRTDIFTLKYDVNTHQGKLSGNPCYDLTVSNIPIMDINSGNLIQLMITERYTLFANSSVKESIRVNSLEVVIDRLVPDNGVVSIEKDNSINRQREVINLDDVYVPDEQEQ